MNNRSLKASSSLTVVMALTGFCFFVTVGFMQAAQAAPPSAGAIQKQITTPSALLIPPGEVINLPKPARRKNSSHLKILVNSIKIQGNTVLSEKKLHALIREVVGKSLPLGKMQRWVKQITETYHRAGYPLAFAYLPAQKIRNGVVRVMVVEPRYNKVKVAGNSRLKPEIAKRTVGVKSGELINEYALTRGLILLDQTPGVNAHAVLSPGTKPLTSILLLNLKNRPMLSGDVFVNNSGNRYVGNKLLGADGFLSNPFGYGSSLSVNVMASSRDAARLSTGGLAFSSPYIWNGLRVGTYGSATIYHLGGRFSSLDESGRTKQAGIDATYPLLLMPGKLLMARIDVLKNWLNQATGTLSTSSQIITIWRLSLNGSYADIHGGINQASISISHGQLDITPASARVVDAAGQKAAGFFTVAMLQISQLQTLPYEFNLLSSVSGQWSNKNLDSSQKFYLGGPHNVLSYEVGDGGGDGGYLVNLELSHSLPVVYLPGHLTGTLLTQAGVVHVNHTIYTGFSGRNTLKEAGVGVKMTYDWKLWRLVASYGQRVGSYVNSGAALNHPGQFWLSLSNRF